MKKQVVIFLAAAALSTTGLAFSSAMASTESLEEECRNMAIEQSIPEDEIEQYVADCLADQAESAAPDEEVPEEAPQDEPPATE